MPLASTRLRHALVLMASSLALFVFVEATRAFLVYRAISRITDYGVRFAVTGEVYEDVCRSQIIYSVASQRLHKESDLVSITVNEDSGSSEIQISPSSLVGIDPSDSIQDCRVYDPEGRFGSRDASREISITLTDVARYYSTLRATEFAYDSWIDPARLQVIICSTRPGFSYSSRSHTCQPRQDPGRYNSGDAVVVYAAQPYSLGSSVGLSLWSVLIDHERWGVGEQFR